MLTIEELKSLLHQEFIQLDKLLMVLASFDGSGISAAQIRERSLEAGLNTSQWPISSRIQRSGGKAIKTPDGYEITEAGKAHLQALGIGQVSPASITIASDLRSRLEKISNSTTRAFAEEAIRCFEAELFRSAVVMSWIAAIDLLYDYVIDNYLAEFNKKANEKHVNWKPVKSVDDFGNMKEADFLSRLVDISVIGKSTKKELVNCLDRRNGCGHPNSLKIGSNTVAHHIEILLLNVFEKY